jgi:hypothetical protein
LLLLLELLWLLTKSSNPAAIAASWKAVLKGVRAADVPG